MTRKFVDDIRWTKSEKISSRAAHNFEDRLDMTFMIFDRRHFFTYM